MSEKKCIYCEEKTNIFKKDIIDEMNFGWGNTDVTIKGQDLTRSELGLFIDRGFLRLVDLDDCGCMDHGDSIEISFCPFCGRGVKNDN